MKIKECLIKIFSIKNIFIFLISYSIFIITYLDGIYELNSFYYSKFDVYAIIFFISILLSFFAKNRIIKIIFVVMVALCISFTYPEFKIVCEKEKLGQEFFFEYGERFNKIYNYSCISDKIYIFENIFKLRSRFFPKEELDEKLYFVAGRELKIFDFVRQGLSSQEEEHLWTDGEVVRIPVYIDKNVVSGEIELEIFAHNKEFFYYINSWNIKKDYCDKIMKIQIPFEKKKGEELIFIKFIIPDADYIYDEYGSIKDERKLGLSLFSMELINENSV